MWTLQIFILIKAGALICYYRNLDFLEIFLSGPFKEKLFIRSYFCGIIKLFLSVYNMSSHTWKFESKLMLLVTYEPYVNKHWISFINARWIKDAIDSYIKQSASPAYMTNFEGNNIH